MKTIKAFVKATVVRPHTVYAIKLFTVETYQLVYVIGHAKEEGTCWGIPMLTKLKEVGYDMPEKAITKYQIDTLSEIIYEGEEAFI